MRDPATPSEQYVDCGTSTLGKRPGCSEHVLKSQKTGQLEIPGSTKKWFWGAVPWSNCIWDMVYIIGNPYDGYTSTSERIFMDYMD